MTSSDLSDRRRLCGGAALMAGCSRGRGGGEAGEGGQVPPVGHELLCAEGGNVELVAGGMKRG
jgi:hypothetical protein